jgi:glutaredoxin
MAKELLREHGIDYQEHVYDDFQQRQALYDELGLSGSHRTVPQIFTIEQDQRLYIGGYDDLVRSDFIARVTVGDFTADF